MQRCWLSWLLSLNIILLSDVNYHYYLILISLLTFLLTGNRDESPSMVFNTPQAISWSDDSKRSKFIDKRSHWPNCFTSNQWTRGHVFKVHTQHILRIIFRKRQRRKLTLSPLDKFSCFEKFEKRLKIWAPNYGVIGCVDQKLWPLDRRWVDVSINIFL